MIAMLCTSPLHVMTAFSIKQEYYSEQDVSLIMLDYSENFYEVKEAVEKTGFFSNVYFMHAKEIFKKYSESRLYRIKFLKQGIDIIDQVHIPWKNFSELLFPYRDPIVVMLARNLRCSKCNCRYIYYDDGIASYVDLDVMTCKKPSRLERFLGVPMELYNPTKAYVFSPDLLETEKGIILHKINFKRNTELVQILNKVFNYVPISGRKVIIFDTCNIIQGDETDIKLVNKFVDIAQKYINKDELYIKKHPKRKSNYYEMAGLDVFPNNISVPFELYLLNEGCDENATLISEFSTAALAPLLLLGDKPRLLFLYNIMWTYDAKTKEEIDYFVKSIKKTYGRDGRICVAENDDDIISFLCG